MPTRKSGKSALTILGLGIFLSLACRALLPAPVAVPTGEAPRTPTDTRQPTAIITQTPSPRPPDSSATPTIAVASPAPACPLSVSPGMLEEVSFQDYPQGILDYLNLGATPQAVAAELARLDIANRPSAVLHDDITGNGQTDLAVSIFDPASQQIIPAGVLLVYTCQGGEYQLSYQEQTPEGMGGPRLWYLEDLNADGTAELVTSFVTCGAHTCFEQLELLSWEGATLVNKLAIDTSSLPYPQVQISDPDADGVYQLEISGTGYGSVGAGPQRAQIMQVDYNPAGGRWELTAELLGPSDYRIHALQDADRAMRAGDNAAAQPLYERVINDSALEDWISPHEERANLAAYARFKLVVLHAIQGASDRSKATLAELRGQATTPVERAYADLAQTFLDNYAGGDLDGACQAVAAQAENDTDQILLPLNAFGYGNPSYTAQDICP